MIEWTTIITGLIAAIAGGGIVELFTIREKKKGHQIENSANIQEIELKLVNELQDQIEGLNSRLEKKDELLQEKDDMISDLRSKLDSVRTKCSLATIMRCESISCKDRVPPISQALSGSFSDSLQKYVEGLGEE